MFFFFFFKQKTAYEMRISDWSSDVCSSDLRHIGRTDHDRNEPVTKSTHHGRHDNEEDHDQAVSRDQDVPQVISLIQRRVRPIGNMRPGLTRRWIRRSEEHTSELQSLMRISYAVFCLKKKKKTKTTITTERKKT